MGRRKKHEEHANHERWLVSYADFITLLFAFFVVLYSSSQVDQRKIAHLALAIQVAFQRMSFFDSRNTKMPLSTTEPMPFPDVQAVESIMRSQDLRRFMQPNEESLSSAVAASGSKDLQAELEKALAPEIRRHIIALAPHREGLVISLREIGFYKSGSSTVRRSSMDAIDRLAHVLSHRTESLRIEGHTDNIPIHTARFASNWELSTRRATGLVRVFVARYGFDPARLAAAGYAQYHPAGPNSTPEGRAHNRRVDIVVMNLSPFAEQGTPLGKAPAGR